MILKTQRIIAKLRWRINKYIVYFFMIIYLVYKKLSGYGTMLNLIMYYHTFNVIVQIYFNELLFVK